MFFFNYSFNNSNIYFTDLAAYKFLQFQQENNYFILWTISNKSIKIISLLFTVDTNIVYLSHYKLTKYQSYSFIILIIYLILNYFHKKNSFLEVNIFNYKGLSIYYWLGYELIQQKIIPLSKHQMYQFNLINNKKQTKNFWRRLLILIS